MVSDVIRGICCGIICLLCCLSTNSVAQDDNNQIGIKQHSIFLELGGSGLWYSLNYDRILRTYENDAITGRIGISYFGDIDDNAITIPVSSSYLLRIKNNYLELGGGPTFLLSFDEKIAGMGLLGIIGYRHYIKKNDRWMYRITFNPFFAEYSSDKHYLNWVGIPWAGASIGYSW